MALRNTRRDFLKGTTAAGIGYWVAGGVSAAESTSAIEEINFGCIGVGGKGSGDSGSAGHSGNVVAICDIDDKTLDQASKRFKTAVRFNDFREMLDKMQGKIDAVTVSTPDHNHAAASAMAMRKGMHCFTQKPLTHTIYEARKLGEIATEMNLKTEMGNQGTANEGLRRAAAVVQAGGIGTVTSVHVWTNRPVWPQGEPRGEAQTPPDHVHWDLWIGTAPFRPYVKGSYHNFKWRGWWDFGTGALGDMACHTFNMPFMALDLRNPTSVEAQSSGHDNDSYPKSSQILFQFPANDSRPAIPVSWYDGGNVPPKALLNSLQEMSVSSQFRGNNETINNLLQKGQLTNSGSLLVGDKGVIYSPNDYGAEYYLISKKKLTEPKVEYTKSIGHFNEFARAIKGGPEAVSNFRDYAGPLSETILLGNLAVWAGKKIEWDAKNLVATNAPEVAGIVKSTYRDGYTL